MNASWSRIRLGLYGIVLLALALAATIALVSLGGDDSPSASAGTPPTTTSDPRTPSTPTSSAASTSASSPSSVPSTTASDPPSSTSASTSPRSSTPPSSGAKTSSTHRTDANRSPATKPPKIYTVKAGDNLWKISQWFDVQGYRPLYDWNKTIIGRNPDLIFPGQKIIVVPGGPVSVSNG